MRGGEVPPVTTGAKRDKKNLLFLAKAQENFNGFAPRGRTTVRLEQDLVEPKLHLPKKRSLAPRGRTTVRLVEQDLVEPKLHLPKKRSLVHHVEVICTT